MEHLNGLCQKIQFTVEMEESNQLPYLDVLVHRDEDTQTTKVYRKKTKTDQYLHFQSHHHPQVKTSVASCLKKRAECVSTGKSLSKELQHFSDMFQAKGYPHNVTEGVLYRKIHRCPALMEDNEQ